MQVKKPLFLALVSTLFTATSAAVAQYPVPPPPPPPPGYGAPPPPAYGYGAPRVQTFGGPGTLAISSDMNLGFFGSSTSEGGGSMWTFLLAPAADYFVIQGLSIGGQIVYSHTHASSGGTATGASSTSTSVDTDSFGIGPRIGYNIPISDLFSFWPKVALIYTDKSTSGASGNTFDVQAYAPVLLHLAPHFFAGLGPQIQTDISASASVGGVNVPTVPKTTSYGLYFTIGGWTVPGG
jgi:hypothetical protein